MCERERGANHCDGDKVHERIIAANAWQGADSFVRQSATLLIESDRHTAPSPRACKGASGRRSTHQAGGPPPSRSPLFFLSYCHSVKEQFVNNWPCHSCQDGLIKRWLLLRSRKKKKSPPTPSPPPQKKRKKKRTEKKEQEKRGERQHVAADPRRR